MKDNIEKYWEEYKKNGKEDTFERMSSWLTYTRMKIQPKPKSTIAGKIIQTISYNKVKVAAVLGLLLLVSLGNYPVTKNKTVGYVVKFSAPVDKVIEVNERLEKLSWVDKSSITVQEKDSAGEKLYEYKILLKDSVEKDLAMKKSDIENIRASNYVQVMPIAAAMEVPIYTVAFGNIFNIDETEKIVNEKEFEADIQKQFNNAGLSNFVFTVDNIERGNKFDIRIPEDVVISRDSLKKLSQIIKIKIENANKEIQKNDEKLKIQMQKLEERHEKLRLGFEKFYEFEKFNFDKKSKTKAKQDSKDIIIDKNGKKIIINPEGVKIIEGNEVINAPADIDFDFEGMLNKEKEEMKKIIKQEVQEKLEKEIKRHKRYIENIPDIEIPDIEIPDIEEQEIEIQKTEPLEVETEIEIEN